MKHFFNFRQHSQIKTKFRNGFSGEVYLNTYSVRDGIALSDVNNVISYKEFHHESSKSTSFILL